VNTTFLFAINSNPIVIDVIVCNTNINDVDVGDNDINLGERIIVPHDRSFTATDDKNNKEN
jgi:hypothetical protein